MLLTFGLLSPNKGIEYVLNALPQILAAGGRRASAARRFNEGEVLQAMRFRLKTDGSCR